MTDMLTTDRTPVSARVPAWFRDWSKRRDRFARLPRRALVMLLARWARRALPAFERAYPDDERPRRAVEAAERWSMDPTEENRVAAMTAADAAYDAAYAAYAANDAANADANAAANAAANVAANAAAYAAYAANAANAANAAYASANAAYAAANAANAAYDAAYAAANAAYDAAYAVAYAAAYAAANADSNADSNLWPWLYATYRQVAGPGRIWSAEWGTSTAVALARTIWDHDRPDLLTHLADVLADAGSPDNVCDWVRRCDQRECWPVWKLLDLSSCAPTQCANGGG